MTRQYIGARYVPIIDGEYNSEKVYEPLTIVTYNGSSYTSKKSVPAGTLPTNTEFWALTGNYNAQVNEYLERVNDLSEDFESLTYYSTPQKYGAIGDGVHDDSLAIQQCINENHFVYFPTGKYRISNTIRIPSKGISIVGGSKSVIYSNANIALEVCSLPPYTATGQSINNLVIDCGGNSGIHINQQCPNLSLENIFIANVGNQQYGVHFDNNKSAKFFIKNVFIYGGALRYGDNGSIGIENIDMSIENTGVVMTETYDSVIESIYCMGVTVGMSLNGVAQIHIGTYHYWMGSDSSDVPVPYSHYLKTRAISGSFNVYIDEFYPDKP
jgi:hypothetical protein